jgi:hypothetical protein
MKYIFLAAALWLLATPALACVNSVSSNGTYVQVCIDCCNCLRLAYADLKTSPGSAQASVDVIETFQTFLDHRQPILSLPLDDEDRGTDPADPRIFWSDADGVPWEGLLSVGTYLTSRSCIVADAVWDGTDFVLTLTRPQ